MSGDVEQTPTDVGATSDDAPDSAWDLPELAPVVIIVSVGLLVLGSGIAIGISLVHQPGVNAVAGWTFVSSGLRWIDPATSTMLLLAAALIWWQYGYWTSDNRDDLSGEVASAHVVRLRAIAKWTMATLIVTIASSVLLIVSSILENTSGFSSAYLWGYAVETICTALASLLLAVLGVVGLRRILAAAYDFVRSVDEDPASEAS